MMVKKMKILVDADACPVKKIIEEAAREYGLDVLMVSNYHHGIKSDYSTVLIVDSYSQAVDISIVNKSRAGDIVVTQDYGLASMVLEKGSRAIHPGGMVYTRDNIETLLMQRYLNQKAREVRMKTGRAKKRNKDDDIHFKREFVKIIEETLNDTGK